MKIISFLFFLFSLYYLYFFLTGNHPGSILGFTINICTASILWAATLEEKPRPLWFKNKIIGWGWTPATWQGWLLIGGYTVLATTLAVTVDAQAHSVSDSLTNILPFVGLLTATLILICYRTGEKPEWRRGHR